ncbi:nucleotidyltransferase domain-containing protein [Streptomonospora nanhaiensis]|uniref:nucleotidyltransferase domain-containing protein n=1 Tax=Streptomonospora nanhaiensis TaxID=1323731 RepID=UPI0015C9BB7C|nr:hypothetical protein [Streptomonospora nanhaiensis]MBX9389544.1 hypothetical protein [Streptomonospora nanhaiensis]
MRRPYDPSIDAWIPWSAERVAAAIDGTGAWLSGGLGLDVWLGRVTRAHGDIDVSVTRDDWTTLRAALQTELTFFRAESGWLSELRDDVQDPPVNTWCADAAAPARSCPGSARISLLTPPSKTASVAWLPQPSTTA